MFKIDLYLFRQVFKCSLFIFIFNLILDAPHIYAANSDPLAGEVVDFIHLFVLFLSLNIFLIIFSHFLLDKHGEQQSGN